MTIVENRIKRFIERLVKHLKSLNESDFKQFSSQKCPDDSSARIKLTFDGRMFKEIDGAVDEFNVQSIYFILESPHKSEYDSFGIPKGAAKGTTGRKFKDSVIDVLNLLELKKNIFKKSNYEIFIINAIQYQTSLGELPKEYRSVVFQILWKIGCDKLFQEKINRINLEGEVIWINSCTNGDISRKQPEVNEFIASLSLWKDCDIGVEDKSNLADLVQNCLENSGVIAHRVIHPYNWNKYIID